MKVLISSLVAILLSITAAAIYDSMKSNGSNGVNAIQNNQGSNYSIESNGSNGVNAIQNNKGDDYSIITNGK